MARAYCVRLVRPGGGTDVEESIRQALKERKKGIRKIARELSVGVRVVLLVAARQP
jgi:hypothetical protein